MGCQSRRCVAFEWLLRSEALNDARGSFGPNTSIILTLWRSHCDWRIRGLGPSGDAPSTVRCAEASRVARARAALRQEARLRLRVSLF